MQQDMAELVNRSYNSPIKYDEVHPGVPEDHEQIKTLGDLLEVNYKVIGVKEQLRRNLVQKMKEKNPKYPEIIGFENDVVPALDRAILAGHDLLLIGQIGQAKTKITQAIAKNLLSPIPVVRGSVTNDIPVDIPAPHLISLFEDKEIATTHMPYFHLSTDSMEKIRDNKLDTKIDWIEGTSRYQYVLATPDISVKDLVGQIDAVRIAKKGVELYQIESYSPGKLMQARHGIFCIDELPVLDPRKQVSLLSVLQEGRFTTGSYPVIFEPKAAFFATANPIDYTHSGKIIEPLFDRLKSHIHTGYPKSVEEEMLIILQETTPLSNAFIPLHVLKMMARIVRNTRTNTEINQDTGISVRMGVHGMELLVAEAQRTRSLLNDIVAVPRPSDIFCVEQSSKFELAEMDDTRENRRKILLDIIEKSLGETAKEYLDKIETTLRESIREEFANNKMFYVSQEMLSKNGVGKSYEHQLYDFPSLNKAVDFLFETIKQEQNEFYDECKKHYVSAECVSVKDEFLPELWASVVELVLEGLRQTRPQVLERKEGGSYVLSK